MLYNILNYVLFDTEKDITKLVLCGTALYGLIIAFLYTKYSDSIPYLKQYRKYVLHVAVVDLLLVFILNRATIIKKLKSKQVKPIQPLLNDYSESDSEPPPNPYNKEKKTKKQASPFIPIHQEESESDIEFPIYKA